MPMDSFQPPKHNRKKYYKHQITLMKFAFQIQTRITNNRTQAIIIKGKGKGERIPIINSFSLSGSFKKKMGCGESKHSVATENTITRKKSSEEIETINETNKKENLKQEESDNNDNGDRVAEVKNITEDKELKEEEKEMKKEDQGQETGRLISKESPSRFFSSRKDEDINEGSFVSEGRSEKSEFFSPRLESGKEILFNECVKLEDVVEEKLVQETEHVETSIVKEEDMAKEEKASTSPTEEKKQIVEEETLAVSPSKDLKAT